MRKIICEKCQEKEQKLSEMGYKTSTSSSLYSSIEGQELCEVCGTPILSNEIEAELRGREEEHKRITKIIEDEYEDVIERAVLLSKIKGGEK